MGSSSTSTGRSTSKTVERDFMGRRRNPDGTYMSAADTLTADICMQNGVRS